MTEHRVTLEGNGIQHELKIDGVPVTAVTTKAEMTFSPGDLPTLKLTLRLPRGGFDIGTNGHVEIDATTRAVLEALGWTPPEAFLPPPWAMTDEQAGQLRKALDEHMRDSSTIRVHPGASGAAASGQGGGGQGSSYSVTAGSAGVGSVSSVGVGSVGAAGRNTVVHHAHAPDEPCDTSCPGWAPATEHLITVDLSYPEAMRSNRSFQAEVRDSRPDGTVILSLIFSTGLDGYPEMYDSAMGALTPDGPWTREVRVLPYGAWVKLGGRREDGGYWYEPGVPPPGHHETRIWGLVPGWLEASAGKKGEAEGATHGAPDSASRDAPDG